MTETGADIQGGCLCGAVRYRSTSAPIAARYCWCRVCQKIAAGNASVNVVFAKGAVTLEGETAVYESTADSGNAMRRSFCPKCGTHLFSESTGRPHLLVVRAGTLDDPAIAEPSAAIWTSSAPRWACIDPNLKQFPVQPPPS
jgi:hypothetical protein